MHQWFIVAHFDFKLKMVGAFEEKKKHKKTVLLYVYALHLCYELDRGGITFFVIFPCMLLTCGKTTSMRQILIIIPVILIITGAFYCPHCTLFSICLWQHFTFLPGRFAELSDNYKVAESLWSLWVVCSRHCVASTAFSKKAIMWCSSGWNTKETFCLSLFAGQ